MHVHCKTRNIDIYGEAAYARFGYGTLRRRKDWMKIECNINKKWGVMVTIHGYVSYRKESEQWLLLKYPPVILNYSQMPHSIIGNFALRYKDTRSNLGFKKSKVDCLFYLHTSNQEWSIVLYKLESRVTLNF